MLLTISFTTIFYSCNEKRGELKRIWFKGSYNRDFNDLNDLHLSSALKIGIEPVSSREEAEHASRKMEEITTNDYYEVEELTHSIPFLVPEAAELLEKIGRNFQDSLTNHNASIYKIKVTSITRTVDDIKNIISKYEYYHDFRINEPKIYQKLQKLKKLQNDTNY